ncbi:MAG: hypothetical protein QOH73_2376 [Gaiellaceae bacterium]|nr:hypothetical protein [Gaiellaceae bacterium]
MPARDALAALAVTDPVATADRAADDALLARILAEPLELAHRRSRRRIATIGVAVPLVAATAAFTYAELTSVDDKGLRPLILEARKSIPLPPGAQWSHLPAQVLGNNTRTDAVMGKQLALGEAQCHWERYWIDAQGSPAQLRAAETGYAQIIDLMRPLPGLASTVTFDSEMAAAARAGDTSRFANDLAVNCPPEMGGSATTLSLLTGTLAQSGKPAIALVVPRADPETVPDPDTEYPAFQRLLERARAALAAAGTAPDANDLVAGGRDYLVGAFHVSSLATGTATLKQFFQGAHLAPGSYLLVWRGPGDSEQVPIGR